MKDFVLKNKHAIKMSDYFKIIHPLYSILQITPDTSIRNYNSEVIAKTISNIYRPVYQRIHKDKYRFTYNFPEKVSFIVDISLNNVNFYIVCAEQYERLFIEKILTTWHKVTITKVDSIPAFSTNTLKYQMVYQKQDALSLRIDKRNNEPLNSILTVLDIIEQNDRVGIFYNFLPIDQKGWKINHHNTLEKVKEGMPMNREVFSWGYILKNGGIAIIKIIEYIFDIINDFTGGSNKKENYSSLESALGLMTSESYRNLSRATKTKGDYAVIGTQIVVLSDSPDKNRKENNAIAVCESYKVINEDNSLRYKKLSDKVQINYNKYAIDGVERNKTSTLECQNLIEIPGRDLLYTHKNIGRIDVLENPIPEELSHGYVFLGKAVYRGKEYSAYLRDEYNIGNLALLLLSPQGGGKTTFISNVAVNANKRKECTIVIDYIKNCELSQSIERVVNKNDLIVLDLGKPECFQGLGFNEVESRADTTEFERLEIANMKTEQTMAFIDSINSDGIPLSTKMRRYLSSAGNVVYFQSGKSIGDVIKCLQDYKVREEYINFLKDSLSDNAKSYYADIINTLQELDERKDTVDKTTKEIIYSEVIGTKDSKIDGILDRVNLLKENIYLKYMFTKSCKDNINFVDAMEQGKVVLIKMPENKFNNTMVKNVLCTFFTSKIILATKLRGVLNDKPKRCYVFYDEISQAPTSEIVLKEVLSQLRKFGTKLVISAHYMDQLLPQFKSEIKASGTSYMLLQGCDKKNFEELKEELEPYELEDLMHLKQFQSLNLIRYEKGFAKFITTLPKPL